MCVCVCVCALCVCVSVLNCHNLRSIDQPVSDILEENMIKRDISVLMNQTVCNRPNSTHMQNMELFYLPFLWLA